MLKVGAASPGNARAPAPGRAAPTARSLPPPPPSARPRERAVSIEFDTVDDPVAREQALTADLGSSADAADAISPPATELTRPLVRHDAQADAQTVVMPRAAGGASEDVTVQRTLQPVGDGDDERTVVRSGSQASAGLEPALEPADVTPTVAIRRSSVPPPPSSVAGRPALTTLPPPPRLPFAPAPAPAFAAAHAPPPSRPPRVSAPPTSPRSKMPTLAPTVGSVPPPPLARRRPMWALASAAAVFGIAATAYVFTVPTTGSIAVTSAGPQGESHPVAVFVDGEKRCASTPCKIEGLQPGTHLVRTESEGQFSADRAVAIEAGAAATHHVTVESAVAQAGLRIAAEGVGLRVYVDGRDVGMPPITLDALAPGSHVVRVVGDEGLYAPFEETVSLSPGEVRSLGTIKLAVKQGRLTLQPGVGALGADVQVDGRPVGTLPTVVDLDPEDSHTVMATRLGYAPFTQDIVFERGLAERTVRIDLEPSAVHPAPMRTRSGARAAKAAPAILKPQAGGALLNLNSIPVTTVILDGRVLGTTPVLNQRVSPGTHTAVFVHPDGTRKIVSASVSAGDHKTAAVKF
jgi:hypothetical protein